MLDALVLGLVLVAWDGPPGPNSGWYKELKVPGTGGSCCGEADCRHFPVRINDGHYEVLYRDSWLVVPNEAIVKMANNPTGDYVACIQGGYYYDGMLSPRVLCFIQAPGL